MKIKSYITTRTIALILLIIVIISLTQYLKNSGKIKTPAITRVATYSGQITYPPVVANVKRVIDGDTIELSTGQIVRYIGIDTPELNTETKTPECYALEATNENRQLVEGKTIEIFRDISDTDKYGRLLRYVYLGNVFVNASLVKNGFARTFRVLPDIKYQELFNLDQSEAKENLRGLWSICR